jgi:hypothetical protein
LVLALDQSVVVVFRLRQRADTPALSFWRNARAFADLHDLNLPSLDHPIDASDRQTEEGCKLWDGQATILPGLVLIGHCVAPLLR